MQLELFAELPAVLAASALVDAPGRLFDELAAALKFPYSAEFRSPVSSQPMVTEALSV
jgi:hypothetical protein